MIQLVEDWYIAREVNQDESLTETLMEWFSHRPSLRDVTSFRVRWRGDAAGVSCKQPRQGVGHRVGLGCGSR